MKVSELVQATLQKCYKDPNKQEVRAYLIKRGQHGEVTEHAYIPIDFVMMDGKICVEMNGVKWKEGPGY